MTSIAGSGNAAVIPGSCCVASSGSSGSATTTARGPNGAMPCASRSEGRLPRVSESSEAMPTSLAEIAADFREVSARDRLQLLLEFSDGLPDLPERYADAPEALGRVP